MKQMIEKLRYTENHRAMNNVKCYEPILRVMRARARERVKERERERERESERAEAF
jgi:hypothetical protein